jgi:hypothetical protein
LEHDAGSGAPPPVSTQTPEQARLQQSLHDPQTAPVALHAPPSAASPGFGDDPEPAEHPKKTPTRTASEHGIACFMLRWQRNGRAFAPRDWARGIDHEIARKRGTARVRDGTIRWIPRVAHAAERWRAR